MSITPKIYIVGTGYLGKAIFDKCNELQLSPILLHAKDLTGYTSTILKQELSITENDILVLATHPISSKIIVNNIHLHDIPSKAIIDCSSQFRLNPTWYYFCGHIPCMNNISKKTQYISQAGCFASGMHLLLEPIVNQVIHSHIHITGITGYSAGGFEFTSKELKLSAVNRLHSHSIEVSHHLMLDQNIHFMPIISPSDERGQIVSCILPHDFLSYDEIVHLFQQCYEHSSINLITSDEKLYSSMYVNEHANVSDISILISKKENETQLVASYDNIHICSESVMNAISQILNRK